MVHTDRRWPVDNTGDTYITINNYDFDYERGFIDYHKIKTISRAGWANPQKIGNIQQCKANYKNIVARNKLHKHRLKPDILN